MKTTLLRVGAALLVSCCVFSATAFSLLGPYTDWMMPQLNYHLTGDIGGPMDINEEYRWNVPVITYGFDDSFVDYFGSEGIKAVEAAIKVLNDLPPASSLVPTNYPFDTRRFNAQAAGLNLYDLKSVTLSLLLQRMGLHQPTRNILEIRSRQSIIFTPFPPQPAFAPAEESPYSYVTIRRNFDPLTLAPSNFVNGTAYSAYIFNVGNNAALELALDPLAPTETAVADQACRPGVFFTGLTYDDVGGLRYLLSANNVNYEKLPADTKVLAAGAPVLPRPGIDKVRWVRQPRNKNGFVPYASAFTVPVIQNGRLQRQIVFRRVLKPDLRFAAVSNEIGFFPGTMPMGMVVQSGTSNWINCASFNGSPTNAGPGVIQGSARITFNKFEETVFTYFGESWLGAPVWGSFNEATNQPTAFPVPNRKAKTMRVMIGGGASVIGFPTFPRILEAPISCGQVALMQISTNEVDWETVAAVINNGRLIHWDVYGPLNVRYYVRLLPGDGDSPLPQSPGPEEQRIMIEVTRGILCDHSATDVSLTPPSPLSPARDSDLP